MNKLNEMDPMGSHTTNQNVWVNNRAVAGPDQGAVWGGGVDTPKGPIKFPTTTTGGGVTTRTVTAGGNSYTWNIDNTRVKIKNVNHEGLDWFATNWKTIALVAGAAALLAGIAALIKSLSKNIKIRYNKAARTLLRMQKDFTLEKNGLNMGAVLPGVGSKIMDGLARILTGNKRGKKNGTIGLHPFCDTYIAEVSNDFALAQQSFNKIAAVADASGADNGNAKESNITVYNSFHEAIASDYLNESVDGQLNEIALAAISAGVSLAGLAIKGGQFIYSKMKDGKPDKDSEKIVQVTPESTREICYAILNNFGDKYINMQALFKKMGIDTKTLADLDKSSCEKLAEVLDKYATVDEKSVSNQYTRVKKAYDTMLKHYYNIGDGIIKNFSKYTQADDEKHSNLLVASQEKLQAMWDQQKDVYNNNFSHVIAEIVKSDAYRGYLDFIINKVIPVFRSGIAGDADYVLDIYPKVDTYYVIRQTAEKSNPEGGDNENNGNIALAKITAFNAAEKKISFKLVGLIKSEVTFSEDGFATIADPESIDKEAYKEGDDVREQKDLGYGKWLGLDPHVTEYVEESDKNEPDDAKETEVEYSDVFQREETIKDENGNDVNIAEIIFANTTPIENARKATPKFANEIELNEAGEDDEKEAEANADEKKDGENGEENSEDDKKPAEFTQIKYIKIVNGEIKRSAAINLGSPINKEEFEQLVTNEYPEAHKDEEEYKMGFSTVEDEAKKEEYKGMQVKDSETAQSSENVPPIINKKDDEAKEEKDEIVYSGVFQRETTATDNAGNEVKVIDVIFANSVPEETASSHDNSAENRLNEEGENDSDEKKEGEDDKEGENGTEENPAQPAENVPDAQNAEAKLSQVKHFRFDANNNVIGSRTIELETPTTVAEFNKLAVAKFADGHDNDPKYAMGFTAAPEQMADASKKAETGDKVKAASLADVPPMLNPDAGEKKQTKITKDMYAELERCAPVIFGAVARNREDTTKPAWKWVLSKEGENAQNLDSNGVAVTINPNENSFAVTFKRIGYKIGDEQPKELSVVFTDKVDNSKVDPKNGPEAVPTDLVAHIDGFEDMEQHIGKWTKEILAPQISNMMNKLISDKNAEFGLKSATAVNSSYSVEYEISKSVDESAYDNKIVVNRKIGAKGRNYFLLSEAYVFDGSNMNPEREMRAATRSLIRTAKTRDDVASYAKSHKNTTFAKFESESTYKIRTNVVPSKTAPLYESLVAFKFDKDGNIKDVVNFGVKVSW